MRALACAIALGLFAMPAAGFASEITYTSLKKIERDRERAEGKTGRLACQLDHVETDLMRVNCDEGVAWFSIEKADQPRIEMLKPGTRYLFTFRVMESTWANMALKFLDARPAR